MTAGSRSTLEKGLKRSMSASPREGKYKRKKKRVSAQDTWSDTSGSQEGERARRIGLENQSGEGEPSSGYRTPKSEEKSDGERGRRGRRSGRGDIAREEKVSERPPSYWGSMNPSPSGIAWDTSREARRKMRDTQASRRSGDGGEWDKFERNWQ